MGDGWPCADRNHSSYLYRLGKTTLLIDCGEPVSRTFRATGLDYDLIDHVFLSHLHCDHIGGFFMFVQGLWLQQREKDLPVHLPEYGIQPIRNLLDASMIFDELLGFRLQFKPLQSGRTVKAGGVRVTPFPTSHLESLRLRYQAKYPHSFEAFSFLLETGGVRIGHSADLGAPEDLEPLLRKPLDLLVCELAHFKPKDIFRYLHGRPIKQIVFIHLTRHYWDTLEEIRALGRNMLGGIPFAFANDGQEFKV
ncbi:MAG: ribonuclease Z [Pedosphaera parvula]|nr:ribonuclease Z [Pedosphaera parvula]